jgi:hypothetical protein
VDAPELWPAQIPGRQLRRSVAILGCLSVDGEGDRNTGCAWETCRKDSRLFFNNMPSAISISSTWIRCAIGMKAGARNQTAGAKWAC